MTDLRRRCIEAGAYGLRNGWNVQMSVGEMMAIDVVDAILPLVEEPEEFNWGEQLRQFSEIIAGLHAEIDRLHTVIDSLDIETSETL